MYAWRIGHQEKQQVTNQGMDDCGESGAGMRLMGLLERSGLMNVLVVVTRWYGGTPLGSARFRHISGVAVEALRRGGILEPQKKKK
jgi:putative IMPACT (imprinted ancient) family translation regulator